jgi:hypothetical protein
MEAVSECREWQIVCPTSEIPRSERQADKEGGPR